MSELHLSQKFARLNPFKPGEDDEDQGEGITVDSAGGVGYSTHKALFDKQQLRVSKSLRSFMAKNGILSEADAGITMEDSTPALRNLLGKSHFNVPQSLLDRSRPLPEYYISSSHNTYLMAHQLYGTSCASAYETALKTGSRCVEIDAWDNSSDPDEPKVTHGFTLVSHIPFRAVCETIRDVFDEEAATAAIDSTYAVAPILLSLENHCKEHGQKRLVEIMKEIFGDRLLAEPIRQKGHREQEFDDAHVSLADLGARISVIVEYDLGNDEQNESESESPSDEEEAAEEKVARKEYKENKKETAAGGIIPELADLGVYAQSVKPIDNSWFSPGALLNGPHHHLINVSESGLSSHLPAEAIPIAAHNARHLMRVFPKGTRISSSNLKPLTFWGIGAQICALNWQTFGTSNQLNNALFSGSDGYILKPTALRDGGDGNIFTGKKKRLRFHIAGATDVPVDDDREPDSLKPYVTCNLYSPGDIEGETHKRKTSAYKHHKLGMLHRGDNPPVTEPIWDETLEWIYDDNELVFLRMLIKSDDAWAKNPMIAVSAIRLMYATSGWNFIRMMDMKGRETKCSVLVKFEIEDA
ncbi:hypothetical protein QQS21_001265 [Conoideocrella luteorostrata]|uniref:Phosphoinositide phospholipase C n=1 Tax=Conoideocrella luteorostrata TaxID=1105319 RepID=A0AAJ0CZU4_9HYPO|nr:hypothetical protein QQS21_001265 [Conoideocrella luteorostrata]